MASASGWDTSNGFAARKGRVLIACRGEVVTRPRRWGGCLGGNPLAPLALKPPSDPEYPRLKGRRFRLVVLVAWVATVWFVAVPAFASGPMCDDRGASRMAPSPVLIVVPDTLDVDPAAPPCDT